MKEEQATPELRLFFTRLLELKHWVKECAENSKDSNMIEVYEKLDAIIKEKQD